MTRVKWPPVYSDPHPGTDHPGEWMEAHAPNTWVRWIVPCETKEEDMAQGMKRVMGGGTGGKTKTVQVYSPTGKVSRSPQPTSSSAGKGNGKGSKGKRGC